MRAKIQRKKFKITTASLLGAVLLIGIASSPANAACESQLKNFKVQFPTGGAGIKTEQFLLTSGYWQMSIGVRSTDFESPYFRPSYDLLYDAAIQDYPVSFGVDDFICNHLSNYQLSMGVGGSYAIVPLHRVINLKRE